MNRLFFAAAGWALLTSACLNLIIVFTGNLGLLFAGAVLLIGLSAFFLSDKNVVPSIVYVLFSIILHLVFYNWVILSPDHYPHWLIISLVTAFLYLILWASIRRIKNVG